jgi:hypothetical protein
MDYTRVQAEFWCFLSFQPGKSIGYVVGNEEVGALFPMMTNRFLVTYVFKNNISRYGVKAKIPAALGCRDLYNN